MCQLRKAFFASTDAPEVDTYKNGSIIVSKGVNITLTCDLEGNPPPVFQWTVDGVNMSEDTNKLHIGPVDHDETYTCTATNDLGSAAMLTFHVQVAEETMKVPSVTTPNPGENIGLDHLADAVDNSFAVVE